MVASRSLRYLTMSLVACASLGVGGASARAQTVLIVSPARPRPVQVAFDVARLRPAFLVTYQGARSNPAPLMHIWDGDKRQWAEINVDNFRAGAHFVEKPALVFLLGTETECPLAIEEGELAWSPKVVRLTQLDVVTLFNAFDKALHFASHEWTWLGERYGLQLKDTNEDRRRYGRYGPPGEIKEPRAKPAAAAPAAPLAVPVAPAMDAPAVTPAPLAPAMPVTETAPAQETPVEAPAPADPVRAPTPPAAPPAASAGTGPVTTPIEAGVK